MISNITIPNWVKKITKINYGFKSYFTGSLPAIMLNSRYYTDAYDSIIKKYNVKTFRASFFMLKDYIITADPIFVKEVLSNKHLDKAGIIYNVLEKITNGSGDLIAIRSIKNDFYSNNKKKILSH